METWYKHLITEFQGWKSVLKQDAAQALIWYDLHSFPQLHFHLHAGNLLLVPRCCCHGHHILLRPLLANQKGEGPLSLTHELFLKTVQSGHSHILSILIEQGMIASPLHFSDLIKCASEKGDTLTLSLLLDKPPLSPARAQKPEVFVFGKHAFCDAFFVACKNGDVDVVKIFLARHPKKDGAVNVFGGTDPFAPTALHHACIGGSVDMIRLLLTAGARYLGRDSPVPQHMYITADPPLFLAITHGHLGTSFIKVSLFNHSTWFFNCQIW